MQRPRRLTNPRLLRRDWIGDAVLTIAAGTVLLVAVFLPWVNEDAPGWVNYSLAQAAGFNGVLQTQWGWPALSLAAVVMIAGVAMLVTRPRRRSWLLGVLTATLGGGAFAVAQDAAAHIGFLDPGIGMYLTALVGVLLVPIGLAAALVARFLAGAEKRIFAAAPTATEPPRHDGG